MPDQEHNAQHDEPTQALSHSALLAACERRAIEIYYDAPPEKMAGACRAELVSEFGEAVVRQMLKNGIGNNTTANMGDRRER